MEHETQHPGLDRMGAEVLDRMKLGSSLDSAFHKTIYEIEQRLGLLSKQHKVRVKGWLKKLCENALTDNVVLKKNRNAWARLLLEHLRRGRLEPPFDRKPDEGPLKMLQKWWTYGYSDKKYGTVPPGSRSRSPIDARLCCRECGFGYAECLCRSSPGLLAAQATAAGDRLLAGVIGTRSRGASPARGGLGGGSPAVARYASPTRVGGGYASTSPGRRARPLSAGPSASAAARRRSVSPERVAQVAGGMRHKSTRRRHMEMQLGASRERCMELEFRLQQAEERLQRQQSDLQRARRKTETAMAARSAEGRRSRSARRQELDDMINKFEQRRSAWSPPGGRSGGGGGWPTPPSTAGPVPSSAGRAGGAASSSSVGPGAIRSPTTAAAYASAISRSRYGPGGEADSDADFLDFLDDFQQQTETLKQRVEGFHGSGR